MTTTRLTPQQLAQFDTFGYLGFPGLLADKADAIIDAFGAVWDMHGGGHNGKPHDGKARSVVVQFLDQSEYLCTLLDDPRIHDIAASILGDDFNYMGSDGNFYVGDTRWHSDGYGGRGGLKHIKIAFYLDPLTRDTGALRVIPGSHRIGDVFSEQLQRDAAKSEDIWGISGNQVPALALETQLGDVLVFNHDIKHSAWGGSTHRRMFTMNCCQRYPESKLADLRDYIGGGSRFFIERAYDNTIVRTANPERMVHLEQVLANDGHLAELSRKRRIDMSEPARG
ncbi:MAG: phytanoyl-CoA dioxygenase family protein [Chloroflexota bacterium]|jgi:ectoine hydroxylase-related dioxygenase (phytanoyl-CoA dioxygenase family)